MSNHSFYWIVGALVVGSLLGWWLGSAQSEEVVREEIRYVEGIRTSINIKEPTPYKVTPLPPLVILHDTVYVRENVNIPIPVDTASIIADYLQKREYLLDFSTDTTGTFKVSAIVEANHLTSADATIIPLQREVQTATIKVRDFRPFANVGIGVGKAVGVSVGVGAIIKEHHMPSIGYQRIGNDNYFTLGYGYTF